MTDWLNKELTELREDLEALDSKITFIMTLLMIEQTLRSSQRPTQGEDAALGYQSALETLEGRQNRAAFWSGQKGRSRTGEAESSSRK